MELSFSQLTRKTHPNVPQNVTGVINGDGSITVNWDKVEGALSYLTHYGDANQGVTSGLKYIGYSETNSWTLAAENVPKLEVGDFITVTIQAYHVVAPSDLTDKEKAEFLDKGTLPGSEWSDPVMLTKLKTHIAYAYSADGTDRFTTVYPNLNLLDGTKDFSGSNWVNLTLWQSDGTYKGLVVKSAESNVQGLFQRLTIPEDGDYTFSIYVSATNALKPNLTIGKNGDALYSSPISSSPSDMTRIFYLAKGLKKGDVVTGRIENGSVVSSKVSVAGYKWEKSSTATPYMPSASEVTTADWPKYVGTYTDSSESQSENPGDYNWKLA